MKRKHYSHRLLFLLLFVLLVIIACGYCAIKFLPNYLDNQEPNGLVIKEGQSGIVYTLTDDKITILNADSEPSDYPMDVCYTVPADTKLEVGQTIQVNINNPIINLNNQPTRYQIRVLSQPDEVTMGSIRAYQIKTMVANMSVEEKVAQLFYLRVPEDGLAAAGQAPFGGFILFDRDIQGLDANALSTKIASWQSASSIPMFIGVDEEGGEVIRVSKNPLLRSTPFGSPQSVLAAGGLDNALKDTAEKDTLLTSLGFNMNFAPVCDMAGQPSDYIYNRTAGLDADGTSAYVSTVVTKMVADNVAPVLKHFPGYGSNANTHTGASIDNRPVDVLLGDNISPFLAGIKAGGSIVMVNHNIISAVDADNPGSLSPGVHNLLRQNLKYDGIIMTDALDMQAITDAYPSGTAAVQAFVAGNDMIISSDYTHEYPAVIDAVKNGTIPDDTINASVERVLTLKQRMGLIP